jgi:2,4-dienoyl-CoA reductase-like NADH-dependent reductase (Old Yellow Enzyme family)
MPGDVEPTLFRPIRIGPNHLNSDSAMAPLTRSRASQPGRRAQRFHAGIFHPACVGRRAAHLRAQPISATARGYTDYPFVSGGLTEN